VASKLIYATNGQALWAIITVPDAGIDAGHRYRVLGDGMRCGEVGFYFTGEPSGRPALASDEPSRNGVARASRTTPTRWTDEHREEARRLQAEGLSWSEIALRVCGSRDRKSTVQLWLRPSVETAGRKNRPAASLSGSP
jgi:hypothetical protein